MVSAGDDEPHGRTPAMMSRADEREPRDTFPSSLATAGSSTEHGHVLGQLEKEGGGRRRPRRHSIGRMVAVMDGSSADVIMFFHYHVVLAVFVGGGDYLSTFVLVLPM